MGRGSSLIAAVLLTWLLGAAPASADGGPLQGDCGSSCQFRIDPSDPSGKGVILTVNTSGQAFKDLFFYLGTPGTPGQPAFTAASGYTVSNVQAPCQIYSGGTFEGISCVGLGSVTSLSVKFKIDPTPPPDSYNKLVLDNPSGGSRALGVQGPLPAAKVSGVQFEATPVIQDRSADQGGGTATVGDSAPCGNGASTWLDCQPDGTPDLVWPIIATRGSQLNATNVTFSAPGATEQTLSSLDGQPVQGTASGKGVSTTFKGTLKLNGNQLVAQQLSSTGKLPNSVGPVDLSIAWTIGSGSNQQSAGTSTQRIYVTNGKPLSSRGEYLSLVDMTTKAASGQTDPRKIFDGIWSQFTPLDQLHREDLDPTTGDISDGAQLHYYPPWTLQKFFGGPSAEGLPGQCTSSAYATLNILTSSDNVGVCRDWADFLVDALASQALSADVVEVDNDRGAGVVSPGVDFYKYVIPAKWKDKSVMLVKPWRFLHAGGSNIAGFPYLDKVRLAPFAIPHPEFDYAANGGLVGQNNPSPRGLFVSGDHAIVRVPTAGEQLYDPSYGHGPFSDVLDWANHSLDGYGILIPVNSAGKTAPGGGCIPPDVSPGATWCYFYATRGVAAGYIAPVFLSAGMTNTTFRDGGAPTGSRGSTPPTAVATAASAPVGTEFIYDLSKPSTATIVIAKGGKRIGALKRTSHGGLNLVPFTGRIGGRRLSAGMYVARITAVDPQHRRSKAVVLRFKVL